jgi:hypothetical protein
MIQGQFTFHEKLKLIMFYKTLFPFDLEKNEYIAIQAVQIKKNNKTAHKTVFIQSVDELIAYVEKFWFLNLYVPLCTFKGKTNAKMQNAYRRASIVLDFDRKGSRANWKLRDFMSLLKDRTTYTEYVRSEKKEIMDDFTENIIVKDVERIGHLLYKMIVSSGTGYHVYAHFRPTTDQESVKRVSSALARLTGTDSVTAFNQKMRIPCSFNTKPGRKRKYVNLVYPRVKYQEYAYMKKMYKEQYLLLLAQRYNVHIWSYSPMKR